VLRLLLQLAIASTCRAHTGKRGRLQDFKSPSLSKRFGPAARCCVASATRSPERGSQIHPRPVQMRRVVITPLSASLWLSSTSPNSRRFQWCHAPGAPPSTAEPGSPAPQQSGWPPLPPVKMIRGATPLSYSRTASVTSEQHLRRRVPIGVGRLAQHDDGVEMAAIGVSARGHLPASTASQSRPHQSHHNHGKPAPSNRAVCGAWRAETGAPSFLPATCLCVRGACPAHPSIPRANPANLRPATFTPWPHPSCGLSREGWKHHSDPADLPTRCS